MDRHHSASDVSQQGTHTHAWAATHHWHHAPGVLRQNTCTISTTAWRRRHRVAAVGVQVVTVDRQGFVALHRAADAAMLATRRVCRGAAVALVGAAPGALAVATAAGAAFWRVRRELPYNVLRGGHSGPVVALYTCSGGLVRRPPRRCTAMLSSIWWPCACGMRKEMC